MEGKGSWRQTLLLFPHVFEVFYGLYLLFTAALLITLNREVAYLWTSPPVQQPRVEEDVSLASTPLLVSPTQAPTVK